MKFSLVTQQDHIRHSIINAIVGARFAKKSLGLSDSNQFEFPCELGEKDLALARKLAHTPVACGHDKLLSQIPFSVDVSLSRAMWQEFDTYGVGVRKQSESTMHTLSKDRLCISDFEIDAYDESIRDLVKMRVFEYIEFHQAIQISDRTETQKRELMKACLLENFLQTRRVSMNYAVMKTINQQRQHHRAKEWGSFLAYMKNELPYPDLWYNTVPWENPDANI